MKGSGFSFKFGSSLSIWCEKVNVPECLSYKSPNWLRYKNAAISAKNIDDWCFQYASTLTQLSKIFIKAWWW